MLLDRLLPLVREHKREEALQILLGDFRKAQSDYFEALNGLIDHQTKSMEESGKQTDELVMGARTTILILAAIALALAAAIAFWVTRSITGADQ